jgi:hypothetical protein
MITNWKWDCFVPRNDTGNKKRTSNPSQNKYRGPLLTKLTFHFTKPLLCIHFHYTKGWEPILKIKLPFLYHHCPRTQWIYNRFYNIQNWYDEILQRNKSCINSGIYNTDIPMAFWLRPFYGKLILFKFWMLNFKF